MTIFKKWSFNKCWKIGYITDVYDGDTVTVRLRIFCWFYDFKLRLAGINAPELKDAGGREAGEFLKSLVFHKIVLIRFYKEEKYGRLLGKIYRFSKCPINKSMIDTGHAVEYFPVI